MKPILSITILAFMLLAIGIFINGQKEPYEEGIHFDYSIVCENGFVWKQTHHGTIQILNSDGKPLKCGEKIY